MEKVSTYSSKSKDFPLDYSTYLLKTMFPSIHPVLPDKSYPLKPGGGAERVD